MGLNDKFLNTCFKVGKILFSFLLLISLIITLIFWINTAISYTKSNNINVEFKYDANKVIYDMYAQDFGLKQNTPIASSSKEGISKEKDKAFEILEKFIEENKLPKHLKNNMQMPNDDELKVKFVKNFTSFYKDFVKSFENVLKNELKKSDEEIKVIMNNNKENIYNDSLNAYLQEFEKEMQTITVEKQATEVKKRADLIAALISLAMFILFLFLPILIRIEENTRK